MSAITSELTISICTIGNRIFRALDMIRNGPQNVHYLVIHQQSDEIRCVVEEEVKDLLENSKINVRYQSDPNVGVANARNLSIELSNTEYMLFADDDVIITDRLFDALNQFSVGNCDIATFICLNEKNQPRRHYSSSPFTHNRISLFGVGTVEIMIKVNEVKKLPCRFPINMGAGKYLSVADEPVFLARCMDYGCIIKFFPIAIVRHPQESSGGLLKTNGSLAARGLAVREIFGVITGLFVLLVFLIKNRGRFSRYNNIHGFLHSVYYMYYGFFKFSAK